ncbi:myelin-associated glycoprotein-like isoform X3 [Brachyhypopomus gauderio]|uniref:myelin-associated glycoprotein-like isoform X3 n=1 Tax=Brachyhypopomus gauderio TaxID=698409 RepID=UPI0040418F25
MHLCFCLTIVCICILGVGGSEWSVSVPTSAPGLVGLCVHIPCRFSYPGPTQPAGKLTGIWFEASAKLQIYNSRHPEVADAQYVNRTRLVGSLARNAPPTPSVQCPGVLAEGVAVSLVCAVVHTCPEAPPVLRWSAIQAEQTIAQPQGRRLLRNVWEERAVLNLLPSAGSHGEVLRCTAAFPNGQNQSGPECKLVVEYAPKNVTAIVSSPLDSILEGDTVIVSCQADSHPPPHSYSWFWWVEGREQLLPAQRGHKLSINKVVKEPGQYWCRAENVMGAARSQPVLLDVLYQPEILKESWCSEISEQDLELNCLCIAHGNPQPSINWTIMGSQEPINGRVDTSRSGGHEAVVTLSASVVWNSSAEQFTALCVAENNLSSTIQTFTLTLNSELTPSTSGATVLSDAGPALGPWGPIMGMTVMTILFPQ